jgi:hypothetical protein
MEADEEARRKRAEEAMRRPTRRQVLTIPYSPQFGNRGVPERKRLNLFGEWQ